MQLPGETERESLTLADEVSPSAPPLPPLAPPRTGRKKLAPPPASSRVERGLQQVVPDQPESSADGRGRGASLTSGRSLMRVAENLKAQERAKQAAQTWTDFTAAQLAFRKKMLVSEHNPEGDSWAHQYHHVYQRFTRRHVMCTAGTLVLLGLLELCLLWVWLGVTNNGSHDPFSAGVVGYGWIAIAPLSVVTGCLGYYGAWHIKADLQAHVRGLNRSRSMAQGVRLHADHGQKHWDSHRALMAYFYLAFFTGASMVVVAVVTFSTGLDPQNPAHAKTVSLRRTGAGFSVTTSSDAETLSFEKQVLVYTMAILGLGMFLLLELSMWSVMRMVSFYDIVQTLLEMINLILLAVTIAMMVASSTIVGHLTYLQDTGNGDATGLGIGVLTGMLVYGFGCVFVCFFGFCAAYVESKKLLLYNAVCLCFGLVVGSVVLGLLGSADYDGFVTDHCKVGGSQVLLKFIP
jgi:hypothetical protein